MTADFSEYDRLETMNAVDLIEYLFENEGEIPYEVFYTQLGRVLTMNTGLSGSGYHEWVEDILNEISPSTQELLMTEEENKAFKELPETIKIYRGVKGDSIEELSYSWTLERPVANWFATRFRKNGIVLEGKCSKFDVAALFLERNEAEIFIIPDDVEIISRTEVKAPKEGKALADYTDEDWSPVTSLS